MRLLVSGCAGNMGRQVTALCRRGYHGMQAICGVDQRVGEGEGVPCVRSFDEIWQTVDGVVDFSHPDNTEPMLRFCLDRRIPAVIATTGHTDPQRERIRQAAESIPVFFAANFSCGTVLLCRLAREVARALPQAQIEIIEYHRAGKADAPSGTARLLVQELSRERPGAVSQYGRHGQHARRPEEIGIHSVRLGNTVATHEVLFGNGSETLSLRHEVIDRALFAEGALLALEFVADRPPGLYGMEDLLASEPPDGDGRTKIHRKEDLS